VDWKATGQGIVLGAAVLGLGAGAVRYGARAVHAMDLAEQTSAEIEAIKEQTAAVDRDRQARKAVIEALCATGDLPPGVCIVEGIRPATPLRPPDAEED